MDFKAVFGVDVGLRRLGRTWCQGADWANVLHRKTHDLMAFEQFWGYDTKQEMFQGSVEDQILQNLKYLNAIHSNNSNNSK